MDKSELRGQGDYERYLNLDETDPVVVREGKVEVSIPISIVILEALAQNYGLRRVIDNLITELDRSIASNQAIGEDASRLIALRKAMNDFLVSKGDGEFVKQKKLTI